jgi:DNA polymerase-4
MEIEPVYFHVDLDAFYAAVEQLDSPKLRGKPVIVGAAPGHRGVVSACSYEARKYGVHSAMPISEAYRRCPQGVYLPVRMERYQELSTQVMAILEEYTPEFRQISVDEAFLNLTGTRRLFGAPAAVAEKMKRRVRDLGLVISIGIAPNRYLAKLASDFDKPDGLYRVHPGEDEQFLDRLQLKDLWGVGKRSLEVLRTYDITTVAELRAIPKVELQRLVGSAAGAYLYDVARGRDPGIYSDRPKSRSMSSETTFEVDTADPEAVRRVLLELSHNVMFRLLREGFSTHTVAVKLRLEDFTTLSSRTTIKHKVSSAEEMYELAVGLFEKKWNRATPIRLIGVGAEGIVPEAEELQPELFEGSFDKKRRVEEAALRIRTAMGTDSIQKASLLDRRQPPRRRASSHDPEGDNQS